MAPGTEFAHDCCTGIGPLQLDGVLVFFLFYDCEIKLLRYFGNFLGCVLFVVFFSRRVESKGLVVTRNSKEEGMYDMIAHSRDITNPVNTARSVTEAVR